MSDAYQFKQVKIIHSGKRTSSFSMAFEKRLGQAELVERRERFYTSLIDLIHLKHKEFLTSIDIALPEGAKLKSWHPKFDIESVPDIPVKELFQDAPVTHAIPSQIKDALTVDPALSIENTPVRSNERKLAIIEERKSESVDKPEGKKMSLLERIKLKEKQKQTELMLKSPKEKEQLKNGTILAEFCENLAFLFNNAGKSALILGDISSKLSLGAKQPTSPEEIVERIKKLCEMVPEWVQIMPAGVAQMVKIDKTMVIRTVQARIMERFTKES